ncbi:MAG: hypothetical protein R3C05_06560 [Pirellulaceae bacterium]
MDARLIRGMIAVVMLLSTGTALAVPHGSYRTQNFIVQASSPQFAKQVGDSAEQFRHQLAKEWLGHELPPWPVPCPIRVQDAPNLGAGGATEYTPTPGGVRDFRMSIQGTQERILDSVLPHEVTHTILATHFGRPLPRWADEGASTTVEHVSEKARHEQMLREFLSSNRGIPMNRLFMMRDYPSDILPLYAQGFSVARFLIEQGGKRKFIDFVGETLNGSQWTTAVRRHYGYESLRELQDTWLQWVADGSGSVQRYVKNSAPSTPTPTPADVAQVAATSNADEATNSTMQAGLVSANDESGWYLRRRQQVAAREASSSDSAYPNDRDGSKEASRGHSIARPQPMQTLAPEGRPIGAQAGTLWR